MHESSRISVVHKYLKDKDVRSHKIKAQFNNGIPDCYYAGDLSNLWIEYKQTKMPVRNKTLIIPNLTKLQRKFLDDHYDYGLQVWVGIFTDQGHLLLKHPSLWDGVSQHWAMDHLYLSYRDVANEILQTISSEQI